MKDKTKPASARLSADAPSLGAATQIATPLTLTPVALTIAGSDSSGGAGIQADLKTFSALGVYGASVITALTAQNTRGVSRVDIVSPAMIEAQMAAVLDDLKVRAIKTGMLADRATIEAVAGRLRQERDIPLVVDPVMVATSGDRLIEPDAVAAVIRDLLPLATLVTPNLPEAAALFGSEIATSDDDMEQQARAIHRLGPAAVLLKGGHRIRKATGVQQPAVDLLFDGNKMHRFERPWVDTPNTHGTGCTLAAAIVSGLASGAPLEVAIEQAKDYVWKALRSGAGLQVTKARAKTRENDSAGASVSQSGPIDHIFAGRAGY